MSHAQRKALTALAVLSAALLTACATIPTGPSVLVLPGTGKTFEAFQTDNAVCREWASQQVGTSVERVGKESVGTGAAIGTAVGAAAGAALGAASGHPGEGAAVGAGIGLLGGSAAGADQARSAGYSVQNRYDIAYMQCMYAKGNRIPVARGSFPGLNEQATPRRPPRTSPSTREEIPPPPPGPPPAPPEGVD